MYTTFWCCPLEIFDKKKLVKMRNSPFPVGNFPEGIFRFTCRTLAGFLSLIFRLFSQKFQIRLSRLHQPLDLPSMPCILAKNLDDFNFGRKKCLKIKRNFIASVRNFYLTNKEA